MSLLTADERATLDRPERRSLRNTRRAERKEARKSGDGVALNIAWLEDEATEIIKDMVGSVLPGPERMDEVLDELSARADKILVWTWAAPFGPILELIDGPIIRALVRLLIRPQVQRLYEELRDLGLLDEE